MYDFDPAWFQLIGVAMLMIGASALLAWLQKKTGFGSLARRWQQLIIGVVFGCLAVFATESGLHVGDATINVRDAAPLTAGLLFGGPAGILAGVIGGVERLLAADWGAGQYTKYASSLVTVAAGFVAAALHHTYFRKERPAWWYSLSIALCYQIIHMLVILVTNLQDLETAFTFVEHCTGPMILGSCLAVVGSTEIVRRLDGPPDPTRQDKLEYVLQRSLFFSVLMAMIVSSMFIWVLQSSLIVEKVRSLLEVKLDDAPRGVQASLNAGLVGYTDWFASSMVAEDGSNIADLPTLVRDAVKEAYLVDRGTREVISSSEHQFTGSVMPEDWRKTFHSATGTDGYTTAYNPSALDGEDTKYAMIYLPDGRALIIGFTAGFVQAELGRDLQLEAENRHVGQTGYLIMIDEGGTVNSSHSEIKGDLEELGFVLDHPNIVLLNSELPEPAYYMTKVVENIAGSSYIFIAAQPVDEASFVSNLAMYVTIFMELIVFATLFLKLASLIRREMVHNLDTVNASLAVLTDGNLDEVVNVRSTTEFAKLSDGINATVAALKSYSSEMQQKLDHELEFSRTIQRAALPSVFPPYPARKDFEIFAYMGAAREVGGDFYDFYLLNDHTLAFLIADVSGKGVPAAMFMMRAKTQIKDLIESGMDVADVFNRTNDSLNENNAANMFVTAWMGVLDLSTGLLRYVNAGHTPPLMRRHRQEFEFLKTDVDFVLGGLSGLTYQAGEILMQPGDTIFIYTDGVTEAENLAGEQFGEALLQRSLRRYADEPLDVLCGEVLSEVEAFAGEAEQFDDITMLAVRVTALTTHTAIELRPEKGSTAAVESFVNRRLRQLQVPESRRKGIREQIMGIWDQIRRWAGSEVVLTLRREDEGLFGSFYDDGPATEPAVAPDPDLLVCYDREGNHNLLELHWHLQPDDEGPA